jgi:hypothetical protein
MKHCCALIGDLEREMHALAVDVMKCVVTFPLLFSLTPIVTRNTKLAG